MSNLDKIISLKIEDVLTSFELLEDWEDRYRYLIDLGRKLPPYPESARNPEHKVEGCVSQVWLKGWFSNDKPPLFYFIGDADAQIVKGLVALMIILFSGKSSKEILAIDATIIFEKMGLSQHLSPMRSNGLYAMWRRIQSLAAGEQDINTPHLNKTNCKK